MTFLLRIKSQLATTIESLCDNPNPIPPYYYIPIYPESFNYPELELLFFPPTHDILCSSTTKLSLRPYVAALLLLLLLLLCYSVRTVTQPSR